MTKHCYVCDKIKPLTDFWKDRSKRSRFNPNGFRSECKLCNKKIFKKYRESYQKRQRQKYPEKYRLRGREYQKKVSSEIKKKSFDKWRKNNKEKVSAHKKVLYALKTNKLEKESCKICGDKKVHAHHFDYSKPLMVVWLCPLHHKEEHLKKLE